MDVAADSMRSVCFTGPDSAATNAGQVSDHVRPDHRAEYPFLKTNNFNMPVISRFLIGTVKGTAHPPKI